MQKVPELVVTKRMSHGNKGKDTKEKVPGWSIEEMKERPSIAVEEDTEEMKRWRSLNQSEMDLFWKNLVVRMEEEVLDKYKVEESKRGAYKGRERRRVCRNKREKSVGQELTPCFENTTCSVCKGSRRSQQKRRR